MHLVAVKNNSWILISNGLETYEASKDVRWFSKPPDINNHLILEEINNFNRIAKIFYTNEELEKYCLKNGAVLRRATNYKEKSGKFLKYTTIAGGVGAILGGPIGAAIGAGIGGLMSKDSDFESEKLEIIFNRAKTNYEKWAKFDSEFTIKKNQLQIDYLDNAKKQWVKYYKSRNFKSVDTLEGLEFEKIIGKIYEIKGYTITFTPQTNDYGVDIIALGFEKKLAIQTKRYTNSVGISAIQEVASGAYYYKADQAIVITNSDFTKNAIELANKLNVELIGRDKLLLLWNSAFPEINIPNFDLEQYEKMKAQNPKTFWL